MNGVGREKSVVKKFLITERGLKKFGCQTPDVYFK